METETPEKVGYERKKNHKEYNIIIIDLLSAYLGILSPTIPATTAPE